MNSRTFCEHFDLKSISDDLIIGVSGYKGSGKSKIIKEIIKAVGKPVVTATRLPLELPYGNMVYEINKCESLYLAFQQENTTIVLSDSLDTFPPNEYRMYLAENMILARARNQTIIIETEYDRFTWRGEMSAYFISRPMTRSKCKSIWERLFGMVSRFEDFYEISKIENWPSGTFLGYKVGGELGWIGDKPILMNDVDQSKTEIRNDIKRIMQLTDEIKKLVKKVEQAL
jgi:hypothetical protein